MANVRTLILIASIVLVASIAYALASGGGGVEASNAMGTSASDDMGGGDSRVRAPGFKVRDIDGNIVSLDSFRGRPVIVWFMAAWCPSCIYMSNVISQAVEGRDDVVVIMVDMCSKEFLEKAGILGKPGYPPPDTVDRLREFRDKFGEADWIAVMDDGSLVELYNVKYIDIVFVIDKDGFIAFGGGNVATVESIRAAIGGG